MGVAAAGSVWLREGGWYERPRPWVSVPESSTAGVRDRLREPLRRKGHKAIVSANQCRLVRLYRGAQMRVFLDDAG